MSVAIANQLSPSPAAASFLQREPRLLINGEWVESESESVIPVIDPATGAEVATTADASAADVDKAVRAARDALESGPWSTMLPAERQALIWKLSDLIDAHADELAELESIDNGKTKFMANIVDIPGSRDYFRYMAAWATKIE
ncbi:MAG: aldehyde dehydrogenase family protein, partial [Gammaproteobacteria bacterium]